MDINDVPDYLSHIKYPMDFRTMREKLDSFEYDQVDKVNDTLSKKSIKGIS